jgi:hypothetical protein
MVKCGYAIAAVGWPSTVSVDNSIVINVETGGNVFQHGTCPREYVVNLIDERHVFR